MICAMQGYETITQRALREGVDRSTIFRRIKRKRLFAIRPLGDFGPYLIPMASENDDGSAGTEPTTPSAATGRGGGQDAAEAA
jgi:hypothetical protein